MLPISLTRQVVKAAIRNVGQKPSSYEMKAFARIANALYREHKQIIDEKASDLYQYEQQIVNELAKLVKINA